MTDHHHDYDNDEPADMSLAAGIGVIPVHQRNKGYEKLGFAPGEGGIQAAQPATKTDDAVRGFFEAVASGADPQEYAKLQLAGPSRRQRGTR